MKASTAALALLLGLTPGCGAPDDSAEDAPSAPTDALADRDTGTSDATDALADRDTGTSDATDALADRDTGTSDATDALADRDTGTFDATDAVADRDTGTFDATDAPPPPPPPPPSGAVLYPGDRTLSPITADLAARWNTIIRAGRGTSAHEFAKVGDSNTVNTNYLSCYAGTHVDLAGRSALQATIDWYRAGTAGGTTPFNRVSAAAVIGWSTRSAIAGSPSPVATELAAIHPQAATVMFGSNDIQLNDIDRYASDMWTLTDTLIASGVVPLITTIPPRADSASADAWVPRYNAVARALAQTHGVPLIDLNRELQRLPARGMGSDGLHMNTYTVGGAYRGCVLTAAGLAYGFNTRNLIVLQTLDRLLDATTRTAAAPDPAAPRMRGAGTPTDPFVVESLPFVDGRNTATGGTRALAHYTGCTAPADESGAEFYYRIAVTRRTHVRAMVFVRGSTDIDLHLLDRTATEAGCIQRADKLIVADLDPGTYTFVLDTFVAGGVTHAGDYLFALITE